jgi:hypothetical protein
VDDGMTVRLEGSGAFKATCKDGRGGFIDRGKAEKLRARGKPTRHTNGGRVREGAAGERRWYGSHVIGL